MSPRNAVEQRLDIIEEEWFAFTDDAGARLGRWRLDRDGIQLVEVFLETQTLEGTAVPDFFLRLSVPFEDPRRHGLDVREAFVGEIEAAADEMREADVDPDWPVPAVDPGGDDIGQLLRCLHAFQRHYAELVERVVVVLMVDEIADADAWARWLDRLLRWELPETLRFMVFDPAEAPLLDELSEGHPDALRTLEPELDVPGALDSLVRDVGGTKPADIFRRMFVGMSTAARRGNVAGSLALGSSAIRVAKGQGWTQQVSVVHMALGSILMTAGRLEQALKAFRAGGESAQQSREEGDAGSDKVELQAKMAEGAALVKAEAYDEAATAYEEAVEVGESMEEPDPILMLEARRMAAWCHERLDRREHAWYHLDAALRGADAIDEEQRLDTTLPFVAQAMVRLSHRPPLDRHRPELTARMTELVGPDWYAEVTERAPS